MPILFYTSFISHTQNPPHSRPTHHVQNRYVKKFRMQRVDSASCAFCNSCNASLVHMHRVNWDVPKRYGSSVTLYTKNQNRLTLKQFKATHFGRVCYSSIARLHFFLFCKICTFLQQNGSKCCFCTTLFNANASDVVIETLCKRKWHAMHICVSIIFILIGGVSTILKQLCSFRAHRSCGIQSHYKMMLIDFASSRRGVSILTW